MGLFSYIVFFVLTGSVVLPVNPVLASEKIYQVLSEVTENGNFVYHILKIDLDLNSNQSRILQRVIFKKISRKLNDNEILQKLSTAHDEDGICNELKFL